MRPDAGGHDNICEITLSPISDLWGPVVTDKQDEFYQRCEIGSNNTGELTGILQALLWARQHGGQEPLALCYDSMYATNITSGLWKPKTNKGMENSCHENRSFGERTTHVWTVSTVDCGLPVGR